MDKSLRLLQQRLCNLSIGVTQCTHGDATAEIEVSTPVYIPDLATRASRQGEVETRVGRHDVPVKQLADRLELVAHHRWWWRHNLFHRGELFNREPRQRTQKV